MPKNDNHPPRHRAGFGSLSVTEKAILDQWDAGATVEEIALTMRFREERVYQILCNFLPAGTEKWHRRREARAGDQLLAAQIRTGQHFLKPIEFAALACRLGIIRQEVARS